MNQPDPRHMLAARQAAEGLTDAAMARKLGISRPYFSALKHGHRPVSFKLARRIRSLYPEIALHFIAELTTTGAA